MDGSLISEIISEDYLTEDGFTFFNTEHCWFVIHRKKVYKVSKDTEQRIYKYEDDKTGWNTVVKGIRGLIYLMNQTPVDLYKNFKVSEVIDYVLVDGEKIVLNN